MQIQFKVGRTSLVCSIDRVRGDGVREWDFVYLIIRSENIEPRRHDTKISGFRFDLQQRLEQKKSSIA